VLALGVAMDCECCEMKKSAKNCASGSCGLSGASVYECNSRVS
jgi:hypothetical protein